MRNRGGRNVAVSLIVNVESKLPLPPGWEPLLRRIATVALEHEGVPEDAEIGLTVVDDEAMAELNGAYRGIDEPTDVLSFPQFTAEEVDGLRDDADGLPERPLLLGDVVVSLPTAVRQAEEYGHGFDRELAFLFLHGLLHLLGHDHEEEEPRRRMRAAEEAILSKAGAPARADSDDESDDAGFQGG